MSLSRAVVLVARDGGAAVKPRAKDSEARTELAAIARSLRELIEGRLGNASNDYNVGVVGRRVAGRTGPAQGIAGERRSVPPEGAGPVRLVARSDASGQRARTGNAAQAAGANAKPDMASLSELQQEVAGCKRCSLHMTRSNVVFGSGLGSTGVLFIGEAPGRDEDRQGLPFVGRAGQLLTKIIEAIKFKREDVYIANVLKCRPPENRNPLPEEVARCRPYLMRQIEILNPKVICTLGVFATQAMLDTKSPLTVLRGRVHRVNGYAVVPTYHPAACLRYPRLKAAVWEDVKLLRKEYLS